MGPDKGKVTCPTVELRTLTIELAPKESSTFLAGRRRRGTKSGDGSGGSKDTSPEADMPGSTSGLGGVGDPSGSAALDEYDNAGDGQADGYDPDGRN